MRKKLITALLTGVLGVTAIVSVSANEVDDVNPHNTTQVTASIATQGMVSYSITIPESVNLGTLYKHYNDVDNYVYENFTVEATKIDIPTDNAVAVWIKDGDFNDGKFYITHTENENLNKFSYDIYNNDVNDSNISTSTPINDGTLANYGYQFCRFASGSQGTTVTGTLAFNQRQLYNLDLSEIAGDYSGTINFHSALVAVPNT